MHYGDRISSAPLPGSFGFTPILKALSRLRVRSYPGFLLGETLPEDVRTSVAAQLAAYEAKLAYERVPAYRDFIDRNGGWERMKCFAALPIMTKSNYMKRALASDPRGLYAYGRIPYGAGSDTSTGTSGTPIRYYRGPKEVKWTRSILLHRARVMRGATPFVVINCFALGQWATGMTVANMVSSDPRSIGHNIGPNPEIALDLIKESLLLLPDHAIAVVGYPPHMRELVRLAQERGVSLHDHPIFCLVGGEALSEAMRAEIEVARRGDKIRTGFRNVLSVYGASDIDITLGWETLFEGWFRRTLDERPTLAAKLFGPDVPPFVPMVFRYDPYNTLIEVVGGRLIFTQSGDRISPRVRYDLGDVGTVREYGEVMQLLEEEQIVPPVPSAGRSPFMFVWGRVEDGVTYRGANLPWEHVEIALHRLGLTKFVDHFGIAQWDEDGCTRTDLLVHIADPEAYERCATQGPALLQKLIASISSLNADFDFQARQVTSSSDLPGLRLFREVSPMSIHCDENRSRKRKYVFLGTDAARARNIPCLSISGASLTREGGAS